MAVATLKKSKKKSSKKKAKKKAALKASKKKLRKASSSGTRVRTYNPSDYDEDTTANLRIQRLNVESLIFKIEGITPLVTHNFGDKSRRQMLENLSLIHI